MTVLRSYYKSRSARVITVDCKETGYNGTNWVIVKFSNYVLSITEIPIEVFESFCTDNEKRNYFVNSFYRM